MTDTSQLLREYARESSEAAFRELVARYIDLVYSVALRQVGGDQHLAQDIAQTVFADFARKARSLPPDVTLGGWLHRHTCFVASNVRRAEQRRHHREQEAALMQALNQPSENVWLQLAPVLDDAINQLDTLDREAVTMCYFERQDLRSIGATLGISEDAAQKRVSRAVEKLREMLGRRDVTLSTTVLAGALASQAVISAPAGLALTVGTFALASAASSAGVLALIAKALASVKVKAALGTLIIAAALTPFLFQKKNEDGPHNSELTQNVAALAIADSSDAQNGANVVADEPSTPAASRAPANTATLRLVVLAADSGHPVPNVPIDYRSWVGSRSSEKKLSANRAGICEISYPKETTWLELTTRVDGFADTRLEWRPDRGDKIPESYTLKLIRPTPIGGRVIDADGNPVEGAKVGFNHEDDPTAAGKPPESHDFGWIEVQTDAEGRWSINRIAPLMIPRIYGSAWHPEHVNASLVFADRDRRAKEQLVDGSHVFQLGRAITIRGVVLDSDGFPIFDADVMVGERGSSGRRTGKTQSDGTFQIRGCPPGEVLLTAEAKGFAATTIEINADAGSKPFQLVLQRGNVLRLRVVDLEGQPVPNAFVWLDTFGNAPVDQPRPTPVQASIDLRTDAGGRVVWSNAPDTELFFDIEARSHMRLKGVRVLPDGEEHVITLQPALVVSGTVRDAETGELIPSFRVVTGWPRRNLLNQATSAYWSRFSRDWLTFSDGVFRRSFEDAAPGYMLKIEAEGYTPFVSRVIAPDEGSAQFDVLLRAARTEPIKVILPNGEPAMAADVGLIGPAAFLRLVPGGFNRDDVQFRNALLRTDAKGQFRLPQELSIQRVIVAHPLGYAETTPAALVESSVLYLEPWGRLEGVYLIDERPVADRLLLFQFGSVRPGPIAADFMRYQVKTGKDGRFAFTQVPPGHHKISQLLPTPPDGHRHDPLLDVEIHPGSTTTVTLGGSEPQ